MILPRASTHLNPVLIRQSTSRGCFLQVDELYPSHSITSICCGFVVTTVDKILTDSASRGPSAVAELLVRSYLRYALFPRQFVITVLLLSCLAHVLCVGNVQ